MRTKMAPSIKLFRRRVANVVIGSSTLRNQGAARVIETARAFLAKLKISRFVGDRDTFTQELDRQTKKLARAICKLPRVLTDGAKHWGTARKALNLFLS